MITLLITYVIGVGVLFIILGANAERLDIGFGVRQEDPSLYILGIIFWPITLLIIILAAPFVGLFKTGKWLARQKEKSNG